VKALEAVIYVPVSNGKKIKEGMSVKIYPSTVSKEEYGYMKGTVTEVPEYPVSPESVLDTLGNQSLAQQLTGEGSPLEVRVDLVADETTVSGYAWSSKKGAGVNVQNGTLCSAAVVVDEQSPASMVIPLLKKKILPFE
jgi:HlyD family secretion protein